MTSFREGYKQLECVCVCWFVSSSSFASGAPQQNQQQNQEMANIGLQQENITIPIASSIGKNAVTENIVVAAAAVVVVVVVVKAF